MIYRCNDCSMIINASEFAALSRCDRCGGYLVKISENPRLPSYLAALGRRQDLEETDRVRPRSPSEQIYQKPGGTTQRNKDTRTGGARILHPPRTRSLPASSSMPINRPSQVVNRSVEATSQRGQRPTPIPGSLTSQDTSDLLAFVSLKFKEMQQTLLDMQNNKFFQRKPVPQDPWAAKWRGILSRYPRILIIGDQGTGKSCLAYYLVEVLHGKSRCYVYRLPEEGISLLPSWLGVIQNVEEAPSGSIILIDESYLALFSRESSSRQNKKMVKILNLARQKNLGFIFVAHEARHIDMNVLSSIDTLVIKKPGPLQAGLDRSILRPYLLKAQEVFREKNGIVPNGTSYIGFSPSGFEGVLQNPKASFWSEKLSHVFASGDMGKETKPATELTKKEKKERAQVLRDEYGYSYAMIGRELGVGKTTAYRWVSEKPQSGTKER